MPVTPALSTAPAPRRWQPAPLIWVSLAVHGACALAWLARPALWPWWLAALALNHVLIIALVMTPRNRWIGANLTRLPAHAVRQGWVALTFDDGPDPLVTPQVLDILARFGAQASFFCIGRAVEQYPELVQRIVASGHTVENHGFAHSPVFALWGSRRMARDMVQLQQAVYRVAGVFPHFFRPTAGFRNPLLDRVLARTGLRLVMWTRRGFDTRCCNAQTVLQRLTRGLAAGDILLLHDGHAARTAEGQPLVLAVLPALLQQLQQQRLQAVHLRQALEQPSSARMAAFPELVETS